MKIALVLSLFSLGLVSCQFLTKSISPRLPAGAKPRHFVVSVHGIGGKEGTFGFLLPAVKSQLEKVDPAFEVVTKNFVYATGSDDADIFRFQEQFASFMRDLPQNEPISEFDRISVVAHSQGGLIPTLWYSESIAEKSSLDYQIASRVDAIITQSTPFWGSMVAYLAYDKMKLAVLRKLIQKTMRMSPNELKELSVGSDHIFQNFISRTDGFKAAGAESVHNPRMLNLAAIFPQFDSDLFKMLTGENDSNAEQSSFVLKDAILENLNSGLRWESDSVVNTPSTRVDFIYATDRGDYVNDKVTGPQDFKFSRFHDTDVPLHLIETIHASPEAEKYMDITYVPERCLQIENCNHPSFPVVFRHLAHCERSGSTSDQNLYQNTLETLFHDDPTHGIKESDALMAQMQTYALSINLHLPAKFPITKKMLKPADVDEFIRAEYVRPQDHFQNIFDQKNDGLLEPMSKDQSFKAFLGRRAEYFSRVIKYIPEQNQIRFQFTGKVTPLDGAPMSSPDYQKYMESGFPIRFKVVLPGLKARWVVALVKPTYTTFVDLEMRPLK